MPEKDLVFTGTLNTSELTNTFCHVYVGLILKKKKDMYCFSCDINLFTGWKPGSGSTNTMRIINAVDPKQGSLLPPVTGMKSVPSFNVIEGGDTFGSISSNPSLGSVTNDIEQIKFF